MDGKRRRAIWSRTAAVAAVLPIALVAACGGSGGSSGGSASKSFDVLLTTENQSIPVELTRLSQNQCKAENTALPLKLDSTPSSNMQQKVQLLAGQNALPTLFAGGNPLIEKGGTLEKAGQIADVEKKLTQLGAISNVTPAALKTGKNLFGGNFPNVPFQYNVEGIFYNKKLFAKNHIAIPQTWDQLVAAAAKLKAAGVTPFTASGLTGWTISRWVGAYILRDLGPDALQKVKDGKAKLTDPGYVNAAAQVAALGKAGYFTKSITSIDYNSSISQLLNGKAGMMYMLSSLLASINDPKQNPMKTDIGFMPFPAVKGGKGNINQWPANLGSPAAISSAAYNPKVGDWLKCIANNYGSDALSNQGAISGFKVTKPVPNVPPLTKQIEKIANSQSQTVLWFEALFNQKATTDASSDAAPLLNGSMSPKQYMQTLQSDLDTAH